MLTDLHISGDTNVEKHTVIKPAWGQRPWAKRAFKRWCSTFMRWRPNTWLVERSTAELKPCRAEARYEGLVKHHWLLQAAVQSTQSITLYTILHKPSTDTEYSSSPGWLEF